MVTRENSKKLNRNRTDDVPIDGHCAPLADYFLFLVSVPHLEYCSPLLLGISNGLKNKLEDTNYYILRTILRYSSSVSYDFVLNLAELQNKETRRELQSLVILHKCLRGQLPEYLGEFFNVLNVNYNLRGASTRLMLPSFNLEYMHKSSSYLSTKLWNGLPTRVRECPDLAAFRRALLLFMARL